MHVIAVPVIKKECTMRKNRYSRSGNLKRSTARANAIGTQTHYSPSHWQRYQHLVSTLPCYHCLSHAISLLFCSVLFCTCSGTVQRPPKQSEYTRPLSLTVITKAVDPGRRLRGAGPALQSKRWWRCDSPAIFSSQELGGTIILTGVCVCKRSPNKKKE